MTTQHKGYGAHSDKARIRYMDGSKLSRPFDMPKSQLSVLVVFVVIAIIFGGMFLFNTYDNVINRDAKAAASLEANLNKPTTLDLPVLTGLMLLDDNTIKTGFTDAGLTFHEFSAGADWSGGLDIIKLPTDITAIDAGLAYSSGIENLSAADAVKYLNGSWRLQVARGEYVDMKLKYADFTSSDAETAIQTALASEGLDASASDPIATDEAGNTFQEGLVDTEGSTYSWRIATCPLADVYNIDGMPATAQYVVVRMHQ
ncbi:MAG: teichoic acid transporter [Raoultibacter sp.]